MELFIYSIYDKKTQIYARPFLLQNDATAIRAIQTTIMDQKELASYPDDYQVSCLGSFDETTGLITPNKVPQIISECAPLLHAAHRNALQNPDPRQMQIQETQNSPHQTDNLKI